MRLDFTNLARNAYESQRPDLWGAHGWFPVMSPYGLDIYDLFSGRRSTPITAQWGDQAYYSSSTAQGVPVVTDSLTGSWTVLFRYKMDTSGSRMLASSGSLTATSFYFTNSTTHRSYLGGTYLGQISGLPNMTDNYRDLAWLFDGTAVRLYVDGTYHNYPNVHGTTTLSLTSLFYAGSYNAGGWIRNTSIYPFALSAAQLRTLTADPLLPLRRRTVQPYWVLDDVPGGVFRPFGSSVFTSMRLRSSNIG